MRTALISVYNKAGIVEFGKQIIDLGFKILASGGTAKALTDAGIEVTDVASLVGGGAILGHRVVTLSREVHAGLLAKDNAEDRKELENLKVPFIDLVCVDLYPLAQQISESVNQQISREQQTEAVLEKTDIGGPTMLRSAAKGRRVVICDPQDRMKVVEWLKNGEPEKEKFINDLCAKAEYICADYILTSARYHSAGKIDGFIVNDFIESKYGENAWQVPAGLLVGGGDELSISKFELKAGQAPSYNNLADVDRMLQTITHIAAGFDENNIKASPLPNPPLEGEGMGATLVAVSPPFQGGVRGGFYIAVGVKHGNPCGAAASSNPSEAIKKMLEGDLRAIFGGLVMMNFEINEELADILLTHKMESGRRLLDGIVAPSFTDGAIELLKRKGDKCRFLVNSALSSLTKNSLDTHTRFRYVRGGFLKQPNYTFVPVVSPFMGSFDKTADKLANYNSADLILAWAIGSTSNSNTVTLVKDGQLLGNGVGQQDRVSCCQLAIKRATDAGHNIEGAVAYSDSFFPFVDGPKTLVDAGIKTIFATTGSVKDEEVKKFCADNQVNFVSLPDKDARGFFGH